MSSRVKSTPSSFRQVKPRSGLRNIAGQSLGLSSATIPDLTGQIQKGFNYSTFLRFHKRSGFAIGIIADLLRIPPRTLVRRRAEGRLSPDESERLLRFANLFDKSSSIFEGDAAAARRWLSTPAKALTGQTPLEFSRTEIGAREVENLIGRLEHGVFT